MATTGSFALHRSISPKLEEHLLHGLYGPFFLREKLGEEELVG